MKDTNTEYICVGKIGSTYGVHGWLKIQTYTEFAANIIDYTPWYISHNQQDWQKIALEETRIHHGGVIAKFTGFYSPEEARKLTGKMIGITRDQLPPLQQNEYYWSDLIGLNVINQRGESYGKVIYLIATGANDVLVVKGNKEHAIPFLLGSVVTQIDLSKQEIHVNWELI